MSLTVEIPGHGTTTVERVILDFTGTLALDGALLPGVGERIASLARVVPVTVLTADTCGTARAALAGLPLDVEVIADGQEKARRARGAGGPFAAVGNGRNDVAAFREAVLAIAVVGPEGVAGELVRVADVVVHDIRDGLDLLLHPQRLRATLRD
jgi:soluble P-type ATPase